MSNKSNFNMKNLKNDIRQSDIFSHLASVGYLPRWCVLFIDLLLVSIAFWISMGIGTSMFHYGEISPETTTLRYWVQFLIVLVVQFICFWSFHTYSGILRYSTFVDTIKCFLSVLICGDSLLIFNGLYAYFSGTKLLMNTLLLIYIPIAFVLLFCLRVGIKTTYEYIRQHVTSSPKVLIYGTKSAGLAIAKMLRSSGDTPYRPVGFIGDSTTTKSDYRLNGLPVFPLNEKTFRWMKEHEVKSIIISPIKMREIKPAQDLQVFFDHNIHILSTPYFTEFDNADEADAKRIGRINTIQIEDLLERPSIKIDTDNVRQIITNKVVLVSGAAGSIGSELVRQVQRFEPQVTVLLEMAESPLHDLLMDLKTQFPNRRFIPVIGDVRNRERMENIFNEFHPDVVYHAAAYKHVPMMEEFPNEAICANVQGTKNMADMAVKYGVQRFVMISTDKAVNPTNIMGASKRIAEMYVQSLFKQLSKENPDCTKFITTRFGNVLGSNGSVIPYFKKQIAAGGPVTVTHPDIIRYFMTIPEACTLVMEASTLGNGGEIFVFDMGHPVKIYDLAKNMIRLAGFIPEEEIPIVFTGLRPGEKLYEELLNQKETTLPTTNEKIMIARVREFPFAEVSEKIDTLIDLAHQDKPFLTVQQMKDIVPEFISKNSIYEQLGK